MTDTVLRFPTVGDVIEHLSKFHSAAPFRIEDADTNWTIGLIHVTEDGGAVWLSGEYSEMDTLGRITWEDDHD